MATNRSAAWQLIDTANRLRVDAEQRPRTFGPAFHSQDDILNAPPIEYAIDGFLQKDAITLIGGPPAAMKTYSALHVAKALLDGEGAFLFDQFRVAENAKRVIYLTPEASLTTFVARLRKLDMLDYALGREPRFRFNTISAEEPIHDLRDERLLPYIAGADIILDTVVRFGEGDENSAQDTRRFSEALLWLISQGARTVVGIHHSPKGSGRELTLDNTLRGSGDYGAVAATVWRLEKIDEMKSQIYVKCVKDRDFSQAPQPFILEARPHLDEQGRFKMLHRPGSAPDFSKVRPGKGGRSQKVIDDETGIEVMRMHRANSTQAQIMATTGLSRHKVRQIIDTASTNKDRAIAGEPGPVFARN